MPRNLSWHVPALSSYRVTDATAELHVVYLQRMTDLERQQVKTALKTVDDEAAQRLEIAEVPALRPLSVKKWIRDYSPSSATTLEIARAAYEKRYHSDVSFTGFVFVDSGWEIGNVVAAHWERPTADADARLSAARVPIGIANVLLTVCERVEGMTLAHALGETAFRRSQVDFYADLPDDDRTKDPSADLEHQWPSHLPKDMKLDKSNPYIISLRKLDDAEIERFKQEVYADSDEDELDVKIYNWEGPEPEDRLFVRDLYNQLRRNSSGEDASMHAFFVDYLLRGSNGEPQILSVSRINRDPGRGVDILPVFSPELMEAWEKAGQDDGNGLDGDCSELVDIWKKEQVDHLNTANRNDIVNSCPVFFLHPFSPEEERKVRAAICAQGEIDQGEDWGHLFIWHGYPFSDGQSHTLEDLRDFFQTCDPLSPFFEKKKAGQYRLESYPSNFVAVDQRIFDAEEPKAWMASSLDFHGPDTTEQLGWTIGRIDPAETSIAFVNLDIANTGPDEQFDEDSVDQLWLGDLKAYREEDWEEDKDAF